MEDGVVEKAVDGVVEMAGVDKAVDGVVDGVVAGVEKAGVEKAGVEKTVDGVVAGVEKAVDGVVAGVEKAVDGVVEKATLAEDSGYGGPPLIHQPPLTAQISQIWLRVVPSSLDLFIL